MKTKKIRNFIKKHKDRFVTGLKTFIKSPEFKDAVQRGVRDTQIINAINKNQLNKCQGISRPKIH